MSLWRRFCTEHQAIIFSNKYKRKFACISKPIFLGVGEVGLGGGEGEEVGWGMSICRRLNSLLNIKDGFTEMPNAIFVSTTTTTIIIIMIIK